MRRTASLIAALALLLPTAALAAPQLPLLDRLAPQQADQQTAEEGGELDALDIERVAHFPYGDPSLPGAGAFFASGTDLAFDGDIVYAAEQADSGNREGGVHIIDVSDPDNPTKVGMVTCPGYQNDVAVVRPGIIALGYHRLTVVDDTDCPDATPGGVTLFDVTDPENPQQLGTTPQLPGGTHTLTVSPDGNWIYASPGGLPTNGGATQQLIDVSDLSLDLYPVHTFQPNRTGCHDFAFFTAVDGREMGACVGVAESQLWDLADPSKPVIVTRIANPLMQFMHSAVITDDGRYLVIGDEAIGVNECVGGPTGAMYAYDISDPELPIPLSYFGIDRSHNGAPVNASTVSSATGASPNHIGRDGWCTAHIYDFIPGTHIMVSSWYSGGVNIIDWGADFTAPREIAHYRTDGVYSERQVTNYWSAYWHEGRIYANDRLRGLDALRWTAWEEAASDGEDAPDPAALTAAVRTLPSTPAATWKAGRFSHELTAEQRAWVLARPSVNLRDGLAPFACRLVLFDE
jgi:hypothetical protein